MCRRFLFTHGVNLSQYCLAAMFQPVRFCVRLPRPLIVGCLRGVSWLMSVQHQLELCHRSVGVCSISRWVRAAASWRPSLNPREPACPPFLGPDVLKVTPASTSSVKRAGTAAISTPPLPSTCFFVGSFTVAEFGHSPACPHCRGQFGRCRCVRPWCVGVLICSG